MRMEELSEHNFIKQVDTVEAYLLNLVEEYFKHTSVASPASKEYVIEKAVKRMQDEVAFDGVGVLSVTLPDDEAPRTGAVQISLEELGGEPKISPKHTAFNCDFGDRQNTACEGNDSRLTDRRMPTEHEHNIPEVIGLEGRLSTLEQQILRANDTLHTHSNKVVLDKLIYTGEKDVIDLTELENLEPRIVDRIDRLKNDIDTYNNNINTKVSALNDKISEILIKIQDLADFITTTNNDYLQQAKDYTDNAISNAETTIDSKVNNCVTNAAVAPLVNLANELYTLVGTQEISLNTYIPADGTSAAYNFEVAITSALTDEVTARNQVFDDCQFEFYLSYTNYGKQVYEMLPYVVIKNSKIDATLTASVNRTGKKLNFSFNTESKTVPTEFDYAKIIFRLYSKQDMTI